MRVSTRTIAFFVGALCLSFGAYAVAEAECWIRPHRWPS